MIIDLKVTMIAAGIALAVGASSAWVVRGWKADATLSDLQATYARSYATSSEEARAKEAQLQKISEDLQARVKDENEKINADSSAAGASGISLHNAATSYAAAASCDSSAQQRGQTATQAALVLSELFESCRAAKQLVEATADDSYNRALRCESQYDQIRHALNSKKTPTTPP